MKSTRFRCPPRPQIYDTNRLSLLGLGTNGCVYELDKDAVKLYHEDRTQAHIQTLNALIDIPARRKQPFNQTAAIPLGHAQSIDDEIIGYCMTLFRWPGLPLLCYRPESSSFPTVQGFRFNDDTAVRAIISLFRTLIALSREGITIGDISAANILINPKNGIPGFIDLDAAYVRGVSRSESDSMGTPGYIDPRLLEISRNSRGGFHFDSDSDLFALTIASFFLFTGTLPFMMGLQPAHMREEDFLKRRLSSLRVAVKGTCCLSQYGCHLSPGGKDCIDQITKRMESLKRVQGASKNHGQLLYDHFVDFLVNDKRTSALLNYLSKSNLASVRINQEDKLGIGDLLIYYRDVLIPTIKALPIRQRLSDPENFGEYLKARSMNQETLEAP